MKAKFGLITFLAICILTSFSCGTLNADEEDKMGIVEPLLQTQWGQGSPYNNLLPMDGNERSITGCGVTAIIQIMKYYNYPERGTGQSEPYTYTTGVLQPSIIFNAAYDWNNMLNSYNSNATDQQRNAVATLAYHVGVAWKRDFIGSSYNSRYLPVVLTTYFGYDKSIQLHYRINYDDAAWEALIRQQLDSKIPVLYRGYHPGSDHSFIIDGYDAQGRFHINWGWNGRDDGWYSLNNLNPGGGDRRWYNDQFIIINIKPDEGGVSTGYDLAGYGLLLEIFSPEKTSVLQNETFTVTLKPRNRGGERYSGQVGVVLVDNNGLIAGIIGTRNIALGVGNQLTTTFNCKVPDTVSSGKYQLRIVVKPSDEEEWRIITLSIDGVPTSIDFTVE